MIRLLSAVCAAVLLLGAGAAPAGAHEGDGQLVVESAGGQPDSLALEYTVLLTYLEDGHPVEDASVTAVAEGPAGQSLGPVAMEPLGGGRYRGTIDFGEEGEWTVRFTSVTPPASIEHPETILAPPPVPTVEPPADPPADPSTTAPSTTGTIPEEAAPRPVDDAGPPVLLIAGVVVLIAGLAAAALKTRFWRT